jgi:DNA-binding transcriptional MerR regulator
VPQGDAKLLSIGEVARLAGLTVRAVRHYGDLGLLPPSHVDPASGYRYYGAGALARAHAIAALRDVDLPLAEIGALLADPGSARRILADHRGRLAARAARTARQLEALRRLPEETEVMAAMESQLCYRMTMSEIAALAALREGLECRPGELRASVAPVVSALRRRAGGRERGLPVLAYRETRADRLLLDVCLPVDARAGAPALVAIEASPAVEVAFAGDDAALPDVLRATAACLDERGMRTTGDPIEPLADPEMRGAWRRILWPVAGAGDAPPGADRLFTRALG